MAHWPAGTEARVGESVYRYERHRPEQTLLYQLVEQYYPAFVAELAAQDKELPEYVQREFEDYLKCGRLEGGFLRVRCDTCHAERLVGFSCKRRGFCPSCGARRMAESAALLVDEVFPEQPVRQEWYRDVPFTDLTMAWVLSFPIPLRFLLASHPHLLSPVLQVVNRAISSFLIKQAGLTRAQAATGAVTLIQRFGSAATKSPGAILNSRRLAPTGCRAGNARNNLNIHLHCLFLDGVYRTTGAPALFHPVRSPTAEQLQTLLSKIIKRIMRLLVRQGYLVEEQGELKPKIRWIFAVQRTTRQGWRGWGQKRTTRLRQGRLRQNRGRYRHGAFAIRRLHLSHRAGVSRDRLSSGQTQLGERPDRMSGLGVHQFVDVAPGRA